MDSHYIAGITRIFQYVPCHAGADSVLHADVLLGLQLILTGHIGRFKVGFLACVKDDPAIEWVHGYVQPLTIICFYYITE